MIILYLSKNATARIKRLVRCHQALKQEMTRIDRYGLATAGD
jgi:hypothetical protein